MPTAMCQTDSPRFTGLFPDWGKPRPIRFYLVENLLETRLDSIFPTGGAGFDEDVNVYISHLLADFLTGDSNSNVKTGAWPLLEPPPKSLPLGSRIQYYRANADHRLLYLGLMNRGDGLRRRRNPLHKMEQHTREQDLMVGSTCYGMAANLLHHGKGANCGLALVMRKLEQNFTEYVQVVSTLATRRLNLGAKLTDDDLQSLIQDNPDKKPSTPKAMTIFTMDDLLDTILDQKNDPQPMRQHLIKDMARQLNVPDHLLVDNSEA